MDSAGPALTVGGAEAAFYGGFNGNHLFSDREASGFLTPPPAPEVTASSGRHVLLANVYRDSDAETVATILGRAQSHSGRILGYGQTAKPLPFTP